MGALIVSSCLLLQLPIETPTDSPEGVADFLSVNEGPIPVNTSQADLQAQLIRASQDFKANAEKVRVAAEAKAEKAEKVRVAAEAKAAEAEKARVAADAKAAEAEKARVAADNARVATEKAVANTEKAFAAKATKTENARVAADAKAIEAEKARVVAEQAASEANKNAEAKAKAAAKAEAAKIAAEKAADEAEAAKIAAKNAANEVVTEVRIFSAVSLMLVVTLFALWYCWLQSDSKRHKRESLKSALSEQAATVANQKAEAKAENAEKARVVAEAKAVAAEAKAENAENARVAADNARVVAEAKAAESKKARVSAEQATVEAKNAAVDHIRSGFDTELKELRRALQAQGQDYDKVCRLQRGNELRKVAVCIIKASYEKECGVAVRGWAQNMASHATVQDELKAKVRILTADIDRRNQLARCQAAGYRGYPATY